MCVCMCVMCVRLSADGQIPAILYPRHTKLGSPDEFCAPFYEAVRLLSELIHGRDEGEGWDEGEVEDEGGLGWEE